MNSTSTDAYLQSEMEENIGAWIKHHVALGAEALASGDGCHPDEAETLRRFLKNELTEEETAVAITASVLRESEPPFEVYRLMVLLCEAFVDLRDARERLFGLLGAIQELPPTKGIDWSGSRDFGNIWNDLNRLHIHGPSEWEKDTTPLPEVANGPLRQYFTDTATVEAEMYVRSLGSVTAGWGYETIDLVFCDRPKGIDIFLSGIVVWLRIAGRRLKQDLHSEEGIGWRRLNATYRNELALESAVAMVQHWRKWAFQIRRISQDTTYSREARDLAADCYGLM